MKKLIYYLLVSGLLISLVLTGCPRQAAPSSKPSPAPPSKAVSSSSAQPSGTLTVAVAGWGNDTFAPVTGVGENRMHWDLINDHVGIYTQDRKVVPSLCNWEMSKDGMTWTFLLRKDVKFHNGDPLTAEDLKYTIENAIAPESIATFAPQIRECLASIEVVDPYKLVLHMKKPSNQSAILTPIVRYGPVMPKKYRETVGRDEFERKPIGSGPYKLVEHKMGDYLKFEAFDGYWGAKPAFKTIILKGVPEEATRIAMLKRGEADIVSLTLSSKKEVEAAGFEIRAAKEAFVNTIILGGQYLPTRPTYDPKNPFLDIRVRKALNLAINREEICQKIYMGSASPSGIFPWLPGLEGWSNDWKPYPYDPQQAKKLLAEAGYPSGFNTTMYIYEEAGSPDLPMMGEAIAMQWANVGIKVQLLKTTWPALKSTLSARKATGNAIPRRGDAFEDCMNRLTSVIGSSTSITGAYEDPVTDDMIKKIGTTLDFETRDKLYRQLGQIFYDQYAFVPVCFVDSIYGVSKKVGDWTLLPYGGALNLVSVKPR